MVGKYLYTEKKDDCIFYSGSSYDSGGIVELVGYQEIREEEVSQQDWDKLREKVAECVRGHRISDLYSIAKTFFGLGCLPQVDLVISEICEWEPRYLRYLKDYAQEQSDLKLADYLLEKIG